MSNLFDSIQDNLFNTVTTVFGDTVVWIPSAGGLAITANVLYKDPSAKYGIGESDYEIDNYHMEFKKGDLPGLKEAVNSGFLESVSISNRSGIINFYVRKCTSKFDGKTIVAILNLK